MKTSEAMEKQTISGPQMAAYLRQIADALETSEKLFTAKLRIEITAAIAKAESALCNSESPEPSTYCTFALGHKTPCSWEIAEAACHLRAALGQVDSSDDQIIVEHMRDALNLLEEKS